MSRVCGEDNGAVGSRLILRSAALLKLSPLPGQPLPQPLWCEDERRIWAEATVGRRARVLKRVPQAQLLLTALIGLSDTGAARVSL